MTETLANGYSSKSTQQELSNEYQHDRVWMVFKDHCVLVLWMKVDLALEGLRWLFPPPPLLAHHQVAIQGYVWCVSQATTCRVVV